MKSVLHIALLAVIAAPAAAYAGTITFASYGGTIAPAGVANSSTTYVAKTTANKQGDPSVSGAPASGFLTYTFAPNMAPTSGTANAVHNGYYSLVLPGTTFVSPESGDTTAGTDDAGMGSIVYKTTFSGSASMTGSLSFFADNGVVAFLNGHQLGAGTNNLSAAETESLNGFFVNGTNTLEFDTTNYTGPTGLDFAGSASTPEPSSLMLLGTGVLGMAGTLRRRFRS